jgi:hypothetical protein
VAKAHIKYFNVGAWPVYFGFSHEPKKWKKEAKRLGLKNNFFTSKGAQATTHIMTRHGVTTIVVCLKMNKRYSRNQLTAMIAHEAVHVWEAVIAAMHGTNPGDEVAAYAIQWATCVMADEVWRK